MNNEVTLFSNGMGHFTRGYTVPKDGRDIRLSFDSESMGDVAASIQVFGPVRQVSPASFTPTNSQATALKIESGSAMESLLTNLAGSKVEIKTTGRVITGELAGIDTISTDAEKGVLEEDYVCIIKEGGVMLRCAVASVVELKFTEESVQAEIDKALKVAYQRIKPGSTMLDIKLEPKDEEEVECRLQYTIPVASWKMRYSIRQNDDESFWLEGSAIIDNNTDEDWRSFNISVVTGDPISFRTDLAEIVQPIRKMVKIVNQSTLGNVDVEEGYVESARSLESVGGSPRSPMRNKSLGVKAAVSNMVSFGMQAMESDMAVDDFEYEMAESSGASSKEVGDFSVFTCNEPVTILAKNSAIVPMFNVQLKSAGVVLLYKESNNPERPFRALKFKNETDYSLSRGKATIYNDGVLSGECVLTTTKPMENKMLPHCLENGVKIIKENKSSDSVYSSLRIGKGFAKSSFTHTYLTNYIIKNKKDEKFNVALEHTLVDPKSTVTHSGVDVSEVEKLVASNSQRLYFTLEPNAQVVLQVEEVVIEDQRVRVSMGSLSQWVSDPKNPLELNETIERCKTLQSKIDVLSQDIESIQTNNKNLRRQMEDVRENIKTIQATGDDRSRAWVEDLEKFTKESQDLSQQLPVKQKEMQDLSKEMEEALKLVEASWNEGTKKVESK